MSEPALCKCCDQESDPRQPRKKVEDPAPYPLIDIVHELYRNPFVKVPQAAEGPETPTSLLLKIEAILSRTRRDAEAAGLGGRVLSAQEMAHRLGVPFTSKTERSDLERAVSVARAMEKLGDAYLLPQIEPLWMAANSLRSGTPPPYRGEPRTGPEAIKALGELADWCHECEKISPVAEANLTAADPNSSQPTGGRVPPRVSTMATDLVGAILTAAQQVYDKAAHLLAAPFDYGKGRPNHEELRTRRLDLLASERELERAAEVASVAHSGNEAQKISLRHAIEAVRGDGVALSERMLSWKEEMNQRITGGSKEFQGAVGGAIRDLGDQRALLRQSMDRLRDAVKAVPKLPESQKVQAPNDERDEWMYEQYKTLTLKNIRLALEKRAAEKEWETLASDRAVWTAIDRYCDLHEKPKIRKKPRTSKASDATKKNISSR